MSRVDTYSAAWKLECLARHVLDLPSLAARREWLADFERRRGVVLANELRAVMLALHEKAKA